MLPIPYIAALHQEDASVQTLAKDKQLINKLEEVVMSWGKYITKIIDSYITKVLYLSILLIHYFLLP